VSAQLNKDTTMQTSRFPQAPNAASRGHIVRAVFSHLLEGARVTAGASAQDIAEARWPTDTATAAILKASASPATTGDHGGIVATATTDFLTHLSTSAASGLMTEALVLPLGRDQALSVPYDNSAATAAAPWVQENAPIEVQSAITAALSLSPRKLGLIVVVSRNLAKAPAAEALIGHLLRERASLAFDRALFSTDSGNATRVAGLLNGVTALAPSPDASLTGVLAALVGALGNAGGSGRVILAAHPTTAALIELSHPDLRFPVLATRALVVGHVVAIDPAGLVFGAGGELDIETTASAMIHMADPGLELVTDAGVIADPVRELWQTDAIAVRLLLDVSFAAQPGAVQHVTSVLF